MANHVLFVADKVKSGSTRMLASMARHVSTVGILTLVGLQGTGCRSTKIGAASDLLSKQVSLPPTLETRESWDVLSPEARLEILDSEYRSYPSLKMTEAKDPGALTNPQEKALAEKMLNYMRSTTDLRIEDKSHGQIGGLQTSVRILRLNNETILGGELRFYQKGCEMPDHTAPRFATDDQAKKAGCEMADQNAWVAVGQFNYDSVPFAVSDFIEWMGN
jgi:hypothetical protein